MIFLYSYLYALLENMSKRKKLPNSATKIKEHNLFFSIIQNKFSKLLDRIWGHATSGRHARIRPEPDNTISQEGYRRESGDRSDVYGGEQSIC